MEIETDPRSTPELSYEREFHTILKMWDYVKEFDYDSYKTQNRFWSSGYRIVQKTYRNVIKEFGYGGLIPFFFHNTYLQEYVKNRVKQLK